MMFKKCVVAALLMSTAVIANAAVKEHSEHLVFTTDKGIAATCVAPTPIDLTITHDPAKETPVNVALAKHTVYDSISIVFADPISTPSDAPRRYIDKLLSKDGQLVLILTGQYTYRVNKGIWNSGVDCYGHYVDTKHG